MDSYWNALRIVLGDMYQAAMSGMLKGVSSWAMSKKLLDMKRALREIEEHISRMIEEELADLSEKKTRVIISWVYC